MDDEEMIIHTARNLLEILGCEVTAVTMGLHALQMVEENPRGFDMVISDLTMPQLTGEQVARRLKKINPDLPVIITTGNKGWLSRNRLEALGIRSVIAKPFINMDFAQAIRGALDS